MMLKLEMELAVSNYRVYPDLVRGEGKFMTVLTT